MRYGYECKNEECQLEVEYFKKMSDPHLVKCPQCKRNSLEQVFDEMPHFSVKRNVTEVAQLAEKNSKAMGKYGVEDRERAIKEQQDSTREARRRALEDNLPAGVKLVPNQEHKPWYGKLEKKIDLSNQSRVDKYIATGD